MILFCLETVTIVSLIVIPILIVLLVLLLVILLAGRNKTDTLAQLTYEIQRLFAECQNETPDVNSVKKLDMSAAKCALLCDRASFEQNQDLGDVPENIAAARKILHSLYAAKTPAAECAPFLELARTELEKAYSFLINTLGITAAPKSASKKFFHKNMREENARMYLESLKNRGK